MPRNTYPISRIEGCTGSKGFRVRPRLLNNETGKKHQVCEESLEWTEADAIKRCKDMIAMGPTYFTTEVYLSKKMRKDIVDYKTVVRQGEIIKIENLNDLFDHYQKVNPNPDKPDTLNNNLLAYNRHVRNTTLGKMPLTKIKKSSFVAWREDLIFHTIDKDGRGRKKGDTLKSSTKNRIIAILRTVLNYGNSLLDLEIDVDIQTFKKGSDEDFEIPWWRPNEIQQFLSVIPSDEILATAFFLCCCTNGSRISELRALTPSNIDWKKGIITIKHRISRHADKNGSFESTPKSGKSRPVPVGEQTLEALGKLVAQLESEFGYDANKTYLFGGVKPMSSSGANRLLEKYKALAVQKYPGFNYRVSWHGIRHSFASMKIALDGIIETRDVLGHVSIDTTNGYGHADINSDSINTLEEIILGKGTK